MNDTGFLATGLRMKVQYLYDLRLRGGDEVAVDAWTLTGIRLAKLTPLEL